MTKAQETKTPAAELAFPELADAMADVLAEQFPTGELPQLVWDLDSAWNVFRQFMPETSLVSDTIDGFPIRIDLLDCSAKGAITALFNGIIKPMNDISQGKGEGKLTLAQLADKRRKKRDSIFAGEDRIASTSRRDLVREQMKLDVVATLEAKGIASKRIKELTKGGLDATFERLYPDVAKREAVFGKFYAAAEETVNARKGAVDDFEVDESDLLGGMSDESDANE